MHFYVDEKTLHLFSQKKYMNDLENEIKERQKWSVYLEFQKINIQQYVARYVSM